MSEYLLDWQEVLRSVTLSQLEQLEALQQLRRHLWWRHYYCSCPWKQPRYSGKIVSCQNIGEELKTHLGCIICFGFPVKYIHVRPIHRYYNVLKSSVFSNSMHLLYAHGYCSWVDSGWWTQIKTKILKCVFLTGPRIVKKRYGDFPVSYLVCLIGNYRYHSSCSPLRWSIWREGAWSPHYRPHPNNILTPNNLYMRVKPLPQSIRCCIILISSKLKCLATWWLEQYCEDKACAPPFPTTRKRAKIRNMYHIPVPETVASNSIETEFKPSNSFTEKPPTVISSRGLSVCRTTNLSSL